MVQVDKSIKSVIQKDDKQTNMRKIHSERFITQKSKIKFQCLPLNSNAKCKPPTKFKNAKRKLNIENKRSL